MMLLSHILLLASLRQSESPNYSRYFYPLAKPKPSPRVEIDASKVPSGKPWLESAAKLVKDWYPTITSLLATTDWKSPKVVRLVMAPSQDAPAYTEGSTISINAKWIQAHPDDFGMVIHELTHVIQSYEEYDAKPGWLVEGIADYIRWWRYEPDASRPRINFEKATYHDAYRTTAYFLAYVGHKYNFALVPTLDGDMRAKKDPMPEFQKLTGKSPDELWQEFAASLKR